MVARRETSTAMAIVFIEPSVSLCINLTVVIDEEVVAIFDEVVVIVTLGIFVLTKRELLLLQCF